MSLSTAGVTHDATGIVSKEPSRWYTRINTGRRALTASTSMAVGTSRRGPSTDVLRMRPIAYFA